MSLKKKEMKQSAKALLRGIVNEEIDIPDSALVFLDKEVLLEIITPKRLELLKLIEKKKPKSVNELALLSGRLKQAVDRDLKILERYEIVSLERKGKYVIPLLKRRMVMFSLTGTVRGILEAGDKKLGVETGDVLKCI